MDGAAVSGQLIDPSADTFSLGIDLRLRNQGVRGRRKALGWTQQQLATAAGVGLFTVTKTETLQRRPSDKARTKLAEVLKCSPADIWPDWLDEIDKSSATIEADLDEVQFSQLRNGGLSLAAPPEPSEEIKLLLNKALDSLSFRGREVIKARFGLEGPPMTLEECGKKFQITRERVRQIEAKSIRRLEASHGRQLAEALKGEA